MSLYAKVVMGLVVVALAPLVASALLVEQVARVAQSVALGEVDRMNSSLRAAREAYVEATEARKLVFDLQASALAADPAVARGCDTTPAELATLLAREPALAAVGLTRAGGGAGATFLRVERDASARGLLGEVRSVRAERPIPGSSCRLASVFVSERAARLQDDLLALGRVLDEHDKLARIRRRLPTSYRWTFIVFVGGFVAAVITGGVLVAHRTTRRIDKLVKATRRVGEGDLDSRAGLQGRDELAALGRSFDRMVTDLARQRTEIEYLQKIGAWQEVARRLAHEIKNPLTPIQLAVQQLHTKYAGGDDKFRKMLDDANEIVSEEIGGLRRLVDAFSGFAKLPRVEPKPLDLAVVAEEVARDLGAETDPPGEPVTIAADRMLLRRALVNLVENAKDAGATRVRLSWRRGPRAARLVIDDDGPGVPQDVRATLFDPYVTTKPHGTGLGLAIVKKTILEHGGAIALAPDRSELGGARFEISLPLA